MNSTGKWKATKSETNKVKYFFLQCSKTAEQSSGLRTLLKPNTQQMSHETGKAKPPGLVIVAFWKQLHMSHFSF